MRTGSSPMPMLKKRALLSRLQIMSPMLPIMFSMYLSNTEYEIALTFIVQLV